MLCLLINLIKQYLYWSALNDNKLHYKHMDKTQKIFQYEVLKKLGQGSFGQVILAIKNGEKVAVKKISKKQIIKVNKLHQPFVQKQILYKLNQYCQNLPFFLKIHQTESDEDNMYLILQYCAGGTLQDLIFTTDLDMKLIQQLAGKMVLILQKLHSFQVIHRDLKPSNFLFNQQGFLKLSDFGTSYAPDHFFAPDIASKIKSIKQMNQQKEEKDKKNEENIDKIEQRRSTFVGTACYMAPQLLSSDICNKQADIWALGCIFYEMVFKKSPFFDNSQGMVWKKILNDQIEIACPSSHKDNQLVQRVIDLIKKILVKDIQKRFGYGPNGYKDLKNHSFFEGIDWQKQASRPIQKILEINQINNKNQNTAKNKDKVILSGVVNKKMFFGNFKQRMMILYSTPKLVYFCTETGQKKGEIALEKNTPVGLQGKIFTVTNQKKTYYFKSKTSGEWVQMIKSVIVNAYY